MSTKQMTGMVVRSTGSWYKVTSSNTTYECRLRGNIRLNNSKSTNPIAVGDNVEFIVQDDQTGVIIGIHPRRNYIIRKATNLSKRTHVLAANIDRLFLVVSLPSPRTPEGFIDRMLVTAEAYNIEPLIIFNKADLYDEEMHRQHASMLADYSAAGYECLLTSTVTLKGIDTLREQVANKTILFAGQSGVGKSALINTIDPTLNLAVGQVSDWSQKGRHTTTFAEIFPFANGFVIDTPGVKEFGLVDIQPEELSHFFPEMRALMGSCRYSNCTHRNEPQCNIRQLVEQGKLSQKRYNSYLSIINSLEDKS